MNVRSLGLAGTLSRRAGACAAPRAATAAAAMSAATRKQNPARSSEVRRGLGTLERGIPTAAVRSARMAATTGVRVTVGGQGTASVATGVPVLDHLLTLLADQGRFDLTLEVSPGAAESEAASAGNALGRALAGAMRAENARGIGSAVVPADEALAH